MLKLLFATTALADHSVTQRTTLAGGESSGTPVEWSSALNEPVNKIKVCSDPYQSGDNWIWSIQIFSKTKTSKIFGKETSNCGTITLDKDDCFVNFKVMFDFQVEYL